MRVPVALTVMLCLQAGGGAFGQTVAAGESAPATLEALFAGGQTWPQFRADVQKRAELWQKNAEGAVADAAAVARARAIPGQWRLLAVAIDACSDSVSTIPYVARLLEQVPAIEMRIVNATAGRAVMEAYRTPDGRAATPTLVLLDGKGGVAGCWIERPAKLQAMLAAAEKEASGSAVAGAGGHGHAAGHVSGAAHQADRAADKADAAHKAAAAPAAGEGGMSRKMEWYDQDKGAETIKEIIAMVEEAAAGRTACPYPPR